MATLAGIPAAIEKAGISLETTAPAPIMVSSPMVTLSKTSAPAPIQQFFSIFIPWEGFSCSDMGISTLE
ncbi:MAG: hypothetical protein WA120_05935 [Candidatus Hydromicrobium sp.]